MSPRVEASVEELEKAASAHRLYASQPNRSNTSAPSRSAVLLRFYGVESGLKAKYLTLNKLRTTQDIPEDAFGSNGHDLERGLRELRVPAVVGASLQRFAASQMGTPSRSNVRMKRFATESISNGTTSMSSTPGS
jgi:hypothetical protein